MQGNLVHHNRNKRAEYQQHLLTLRFQDKSLEKKYLVTRWRETILTNRRYSAFLVLNSAILIIYEHFWKFNDISIVMYRCLFHLLPLLVFMFINYFIFFKMHQELSKKAIRVAWLYSAVREKVVNRYRLIQILLMLILISTVSIYFYLTTGTIDAPFETVLMIVYLQISITTRIGTSYFILASSLFVIQTLAITFYRPDASNYIVAILFSGINAILFIRLTAIKRRKLFIFESSEQSGLFSQLDSSVKSIETISNDYRQSMSSSQRYFGNTTTHSSVSTNDERYNFLENVLSLYSE